jgi:hypothetical protein
MQLASGAFPLQNADCTQQERVMVLGRLGGVVLVVGAGALAVTAIVVAPAIFKSARPLVREGLRRGMSIYDRARTSATQLAEDIEDLVAEVRAESGDRGRKAEAPAPAPGAHTA